MHSTNLSESVTASSLATDLTELLLQPRRVYLRKKEARSSYVVDIRKKLAHGIAMPFRMLLAVSFSDLEDGVALAIVLRPYEAIIALLREHVARHTRGTGLPFQARIAALVARETRAQSKLDLAQLRVIADPMDMTARVDMRQASCEYRAILDEIDALLDERRAADQGLVA